MNDLHAFRGRRSVRLKTHNYRWSALYFVTIRAEIAEPVFEIPELHTIVEQEWHALPARFPVVRLDEFIIMPDHIHFILEFCVMETPGPSLGQVVGAYKSLTTNRWFKRLEAQRQSWPHLLWQRSYYEHVIRDQAELEQKRHYIRDNPRRWQGKHADRGRGHERLWDGNHECSP